MSRVLGVRSKTNINIVGNPAAQRHSDQLLTVSPAHSTPSLVASVASRKSIFYMEEN